LISSSLLRPSFVVVFFFFFFEISGLGDYQFFTFSSILPLTASFSSAFIVLPWAAFRCPARFFMIPVKCLSLAVASEGEVTFPDADGSSFLDLVGSHRLAFRFFLSQGLRPGGMGDLEVFCSRG